MRLSRVDPFPHEPADHSTRADHCRQLLRRAPRTENSGDDAGRSPSPSTPRGPPACRSRRGTSQIPCRAGRLFQDHPDGQRPPSDSLTRRTLPPADSASGCCRLPWCTTTRRPIPRGDISGESHSVSHPSRCIGSTRSRRLQYTSPAAPRSCGDFPLDTIACTRPRRRRRPPPDRVFAWFSARFLKFPGAPPRLFISREPQRSNLLFYGLILRPFTFHSHTSVSVCPRTA